MKHASPSIAQQTHNKYYGAGGFGAIGAFFGNYANFTGRSTRREYWWLTLFASLVSFIVSFAMIMAVIRLIMAHADELNQKPSLGTAMGWLGGMVVMLIIVCIAYLACLVPSIALGVRRFRDAGVHWGIFAALEVIDLVAVFVFLNNAKVMYLISVPIAIIMLVIEVLPTKNPPTDDLSK
ncbi:DUF805 domain-containing protein [Lacticaseibacillus baoqingensis]|uniref:DUF805 domain-containing protein n=1 Tax=Lacticaseibacillus baoqingensis TaxID=2486013 RepID=A0ABW4E5G5_9LACO|nr:DUF805 domain-containing protein [Lacticaseibacillus baoqingensis]